GYAVETTNPEAAARQSCAEALQARVRAAAAFIEPEILTMEPATLGRWLEEDSGLAVSRHYLWATFAHLYRNYYVYTYATGIAAAHACARRIREGAAGVVEGYRRFLAAGNSLYPLDAFALTGIDMRRPEPVEEAFAMLADLVERLAELLGQNGRGETG
ncbi:MAG: M3 family metallopeptidase, partial [Caldilineales bacterium]|nr:M3 family metallopeptidase [Caldilineales bacterium]